MSFIPSGARAVIAPCLVFMLLAVAIIVAQQPPTFRSGVTAVPIDVRVIDKDGKPIVDLRQEDFTVLDDGVPQTIAHFAANTLTAKAPRAGLRARPETPAYTASSATAPQDYRVFLIVLGTRALGDTKAHPETLDALLDFVRRKLLPRAHFFTPAFGSGLPAWAASVRRWLPPNPPALNPLPHQRLLGPGALR